ncbi:unnamed protein product [Spodoptera exigua]|nr:unnamed protein product [Spodoptera exigua]
MDVGEGGGPKPPAPKKHKLKDLDDGGGGKESDFLPYLKPGYKRLYPENSSNLEFKVYVQGEKIGNKSPTFLNHIFVNEVKGVVAIRRINANKIAVVFKQYNTANNFISNSSFLEKYNFKAFIPAADIEKTGIIRYVPTNLSNKELYSKLESEYEIIAVRRFTKKVGQERVPLHTVSITFLSSSLPQNVQYDLFSYRIFDYIPPLQQCYRCFKFNHSAKICNGKQKCSICAGDHSYRECDNPSAICCANCGGPHLAISKACEIKLKKIMEKKERITYASKAETKLNVTQGDFPPLRKPRPQVNVNKNSVVNKNVNSAPINNVPVNTEPKIISVADVKAQLLANNDLLKAIVRTLIVIANKGKDDPPINTTTIKDILLENLT